MTDNDITLRGNVTGDPEVRFTPSGIAVVSFDLAVNRRWIDQGTNEQREDTMFIQCQAWRQLAEHIATSVTKGMRLLVNGRLEQNSWTADDGSPRSKHRVVATDVGISMMFGTAEFTRAARANAAATNAGEAPASAREEAAATAPAPDAEEPF